MEELKQLIKEEKPLLQEVMPLLREVHSDVANLSAIFIPFLERMDNFMESIENFIVKEKEK